MPRSSTMIASVIQKGAKPQILAGNHKTFCLVPPKAPSCCVVFACRFDLAQRLSLQARLTMRLKSSEDFR